MRLGRVKNTIRKWLGFPPDNHAQEVEQKVRASNPGFSDMKINAYLLDEEGQYFSLRKAENGRVLTVRTYSQKGKNANTSLNPFGDGPGFIDKVYLIPDGKSLAQTITRILVKEKMGL